MRYLTECTMTKPSHAKTVALSSPSLLLSRNFSLKKDLQTNRNAANPAVTHAKTTPEAIFPAVPAQEKCLMLFAPDVEKTAKFLFNPEMIVRFIAAIVLQPKEDKNLAPFRVLFLFTSNY